MELRPRQLKKLTHRDLDEARLILKRKKQELSPALKEQLESALAAVLHDLAAKDWEKLEASREQLCRLIETDLAAYRPNQYWESFKALLLAVMIALFIRWLFVEPFRIPSGSMIPSLLIGDQLLVNKLVFGPNLPFTTRKLWLPRAPKRGEVVVFRYPKDPKTDYIKRVVGLPGDKIEMRDGILFVNDQKIERVQAGTYDGPIGESGCSNGPFALFDEQMGQCNHHIILCTDEWEPRRFGPIIVEPDHFFAMGDNRDKSSDSRSWGQVPFSHLKGKALFIHLPLDPDRHYLPRWGRFFKWIDC
jgi:signal peptidase I